jgi:hypothetical protein
MEFTIEEQKDVIMRQTNYTSEQTEVKLKQFNNDITAVIREYIIGENILENEKKNEQNLSINQHIYSEIRHLMDGASKTYLTKKV